MTELTSDVLNNTWTILWQNEIASTTPATYDKLAQITPNAIQSIIYFHMPISRCPSERTLAEKAQRINLLLQL
jgi:hypothetical protein